MNSLFTVWVGGVEVTDFYIDIYQALDIAEYYRNNGYTDVLVGRVV